MGKISKFVGVSLLSSVFVVSGCFGGDELSQEEVKDLMSNSVIAWEESDTSQFELSLDLDAEVASERDGNHSLEFEGVLTGGSSITDKETGRFDFELDVDGEGSMDDADSQDLSASMKFVDDNFYFIVNDFPTFTAPGSESVNTVVALFSGKWWSMPLPEEIYEELQLTVPNGESPSEIEQLFEDTDFFMTVVEDGSATVHGVKSDKYKVQLNKEAIAEYVVEAAELEGTPMTVEEQQDFELVLEKVDFDLTIAIAQDGGYLTQVVGSINVDLEDGDVEGMEPGDSLDMEMSFDWQFFGYKEEFVVEAPEDATPFDLGAMFGAPGLGGGLDTNVEIPDYPTTIPTDLYTEY